MILAKSQNGSKLHRIAPRMPYLQLQDVSQLVC